MCVCGVKGGSGSEERTFGSAKCQEMESFGQRVEAGEKIPKLGQHPKVWTQELGQLPKWCHMGVGGWCNFLF
jgi:hypothetical protein